MRKIVIISLLFVGCAVDNAVQVKVAVRKVKDVRFLAADTTLHAEFENAEFSMCQARHICKVLELDQQWEKPFTLAYPGGILVDEDGRLRMYYELLQISVERCCAVAFSEDGIVWTKPRLGLTHGKYFPEDNGDDNLINLIDTKWYRGTCVFRDPAAPADERYKMSWRIGGEMFTAVSADGLTFRNVGMASNEGNLDSSNVSFLDPMTGKYTIYCRWWFDKLNAQGKKDPLPVRIRRPNRTRRGISMKRSGRWDGDWPGKRKLIVDPKNVLDEDGWIDIYTPCVQPYYGQYVALPTVYFRIPFPDYTSTSGPLYPVFMHSVDGEQWHFPARKHPLIDLTDNIEKKGEIGMVFCMPTMLERDSELWIYYVYHHRKHHKPLGTSEPAATIHLAKLRIDGFAVVRPKTGKIGRWTTPLLHLDKDVKALVLNVDAKGAVRVEVLDAETKKPIKGFDVANALPISGDHLNAQATWKNARLEKLAGRNICLRFHLDDAGIYGFRFSFTAPIK